MPLSQFLNPATSLCLWLILTQHFDYRLLSLSKSGPPYLLNSAVFSCLVTVSVTDRQTDICVVWCEVIVWELDDLSDWCVCVDRALWQTFLCGEKSWGGAIFVFTYIYIYVYCLQCIDTVGWVTGRAPGCPSCGVVLALLSVWSEVQTCIWPSWCHCYSLSLASVKSWLVLPFWYRLTRVVPDNGPLNVCVCVCVCVCVRACVRVVYMFIFTACFEQMNARSWFALVLGGVVWSVLVMVWELLDLHVSMLTGRCSRAVTRWCAS